MSAPAGNQNAVKENRRWAEALNRAIAQDEGKRLRAAAEKLLDIAAEGQSWAIKELADRLDGKSLQSTELTGKDGGPIQTKDVSVDDLARWLGFELAKKVQP